MDTQVVLDNIFIFFAAVLVLLMQAGFALVEAGLTQAKNSANIMMKNLMDACVGILAWIQVINATLARNVSNRAATKCRNGFS